MVDTPAVLQLCPSLKEGGVERSTLEMATFLEKQGWKSHIAAHAGPLTQMLPLETTFHPLPLHHRDPFFTIYNAYRIAKLVQKHNISFIHARSRGPAWSAYLASKWTGTPYITTFHSTYGLKGFAKKAYNSVMVKGAHVIANSQFIKNHISENYGIPADLIPIAPRGYDPHVFSANNISNEELANLKASMGIMKDVPILLLVGRISRKKGQKILLEALTHLKDLPWVALFAGGADKKQTFLAELQNFCQTHNIEDRVHWLGSRTDVAKLYALADIAISPSTEPEAFGRVAVEAQAMKTPIIATNHGGSLETVQDGITGWLIPPDNPEILAKTIRKALTDTKRLSTMGDEAYRWVSEHFTTEMTCQKEFAEYQHIIKK
ncbi:MAG: glycosyltransferase family 4 protein [Alphaproteobacteria bacterium]|nr:glycosyltransferase family 4 protein [Alphaproteobacteria bacterium]MDD9920208.1 glycosyltransferase family 4 protein [Alphaproteobacteria bacterium]